MNKNVIGAQIKSDPCEEHKQIVLSPSIELCSKITQLQKHFSFRNKQIVIENAISLYYLNTITNRQSEMAGDQAEDENR